MKKLWISWPALDMAQKCQGYDDISSAIATQTQNAGMEKFCCWFPCLGKISTQPYTFILHTHFNCIQINCLCEKVWDCCLYMVLWWNPSTSSDGFFLLLLAALYNSISPLDRFTNSGAQRSMCSWSVFRKPWFLPYIFCNLTVSKLQKMYGKIEVF